MFVSALCNHNSPGSMLSTANRTVPSNEGCVWLMDDVKDATASKGDAGLWWRSGMGNGNTALAIHSGQGLFSFTYELMKTSHISSIRSFWTYILLRRRNPIATSNATLMQRIINYVFVHLIFCYISIVFNVHIDDNAIHMLQSHTNYLTSKFSIFACYGNVRLNIVVIPDMTSLYFNGWTWEI